MLGTLFGLAWAVAMGFIWGRLFEWGKQRKKISLLRDSLDFWRKRADKFDSELDFLVLDRSRKGGGPSFHGDVWDRYE
jgi:hypothetical protein